MPKKLLLPSIFLLIVVLALTSFFIYNLQNISKTKSDGNDLSGQLYTPSGESKYQSRVYKSEDKKIVEGLFTNDFNNLLENKTLRLSIDFGSSYEVEVRDSQIPKNRNNEVIMSIVSSEENNPGVDFTALFYLYITLDESVEGYSTKKLNGEKILYYDSKTYLEGGKIINDPLIHRSYIRKVENEDYHIGLYCTFKESYSSQGYERCEEIINDLIIYIE
ncbi:MAG: hypothetical protein QXP66_04415 [Candidatus Aenigmatarchaeota archaeon]